MPDWFYRTVSQPILFRLPAEPARDFTLGFLGGLARLPLGTAVIDFLGHLRPDLRLRRSIGGVDFPTSVGLGPAVDGKAAALPALARFGLGFVEIGPVSLAGSLAAQSIARRPAQQALWFPDPPATLSLASARSKLAEVARFRPPPLIVRLGPALNSGAEQLAEECRRIIDELAREAQLFSLLTLRLALADGWSAKQWTVHLQTVLDAARTARPPRPVLLGVPADLDISKTEPWILEARAAGIAGFLIDGSIGDRSDGRLVGVPARRPALEVVRHLRSRCGQDLMIIGSGGVHEPEDARAFLAAGADVVEIDSGLVYSGPGLPKRINQFLLFQATRAASEPVPAERPAESSWFWTALMGAGMLLGSVLALVIAVTRVVLPYDEAFAGMAREDFAAVNPRLLAFMTHDRVSLAGTMVAIGILYVGLSVFGIRRGLHWAQKSVFYSAFTGFGSFFLFLGFGYLDPFHAFVTAVLFQFLLLGVHSRLGTYVPEIPPALREDRAWRLGLWGQLLLVVHGFSLLAAGTAISLIGVTRTFVPEDLAFMQTTAEALQAANPRLVPVVAHDRATFGGMILAAGWAFLLPALWGFDTGRAWLWWTLLAAGLPAYVAAIGVHFAVGYLEPMHLLPAFLGLFLFLVGLGLSHPYLASHKN
jgi:dihydroorotate dehydrogenase